MIIFFFLADRQGLAENFPSQYIQIVFFFLVKFKIKIF